MTLSIMTPSIMGLLSTVCINDTQHNGLIGDVSTIVASAVMLSVAFFLLLC